MDDIFASDLVSRVGPSRQRAGLDRVSHEDRAKVVELLGSFGLEAT